MAFRFVILLIVQLTALSSFGQTCCSAGTPVSAFLQIADANDRSFSFQLNYEYKSINLLVDNNTRLENDPRTRFGQNTTLKVDYTFNNRWAFSALLPLVHHSRSTLSDSQNSFGIGDLSLLAQYRLFKSTLHNLNVSLGMKLPIGVTSHKGTSQIFLSPDMQSGSGSFDFLVRTSYSKSDFLLPFLTGSVSLVYRKNGANENFGSSASFEGRRFAFGDEIISIFGLRYLKIYNIGFLIPDLSIKFRRGGANMEQNVSSPNSGGNWLSLPVGLSFAPGESKSIRIYAEFPIYQDLKGLQITTDFLVGVQFIYNGNSSKYLSKK